MNSLRPVILGILAALLSAAIILGSLSLAMTEGSRRIALAPTDTPGPTLAPGAPSPTPTLAVSPSPTSSCPVPTGWVVIIIQPGDTIQSLAKAYGTTPAELAVGNCLPSENVTLRSGSRFAVPGLPSITATLEESPTFTNTPTETLFPTEPPPPCTQPGGWVIYIVQKGDTLTRIATLFQTTVTALRGGNCMSGDYIYAGQKLWVPDNPTITPEVSKTPTPTRTPGSTATPSEAPTSPTPSTDTETPTATPSETPAIPPTPTDTETPAASPTPSETPVPPTPSETPTVPPAPTGTETPTSPPTLAATEPPPG